MLVIQNEFACHVQVCHHGLRPCKTIRWVQGFPNADIELGFFLVLINSNVHLFKALLIFNHEETTPWQATLFGKHDE